jgi:hypothetical protein
VLFSQGAAVSKNPATNFGNHNSIPLAVEEEFYWLDADLWRDSKTGRIDRVEIAWQRAIVAASIDLPTVNPSAGSAPEEGDMSL